MKYSIVEPWQDVDMNDVVYERGSLYEYLHQVADPRHAQGKRYALETLLMMIFLAKLSGADNPSAIADWCRARTEALQAMLQLPRARTPHHNTVRRVFADSMDEDEFEQLMRAYGAQQRQDQPAEQVVALDGKRQLGSLAAGESEGEATMAAYAPERQEVLAQIGINPREGEILTARKLLEQIPLAGRIVLADAIHTQRNTCRQIVQAQGAYVFSVKGNQPTTLRAIEQLFAQPADPTQATDFQTARTTDKKHGRLEVRTLTTSSQLNGSLRWPHLGQVFRLERKFLFLRKGQVVRTEQEVQYGLTSLSARQANAAQLLALKRQYWQIETGLHYRRDVTFHEDATRMSRPRATRNLTIIHNTIISLFGRLGQRNFAFTRRMLDGNLGKAFSLLISAHPRL